MRGVAEVDFEHCRGFEDAEQACVRTERSEHGSAKERAGTILYGTRRHQLLVRLAGSESKEAAGGAAAL